MRATFATLIISMIAFGAQPGMAQETGWRDQDGKPLPDTPTQKTSKGFAGSLLLTSDADWQEKWAKAETPHFNTTEVVKLGEQVFLLVLYANPKPDAKGDIRVTCDVEILRPDGTKSTDEHDLVCAAGKFAGNPYDMRLADMTPAFIGEPSDPPGIWIIRVRLTDTVRAASVQLLQTFEYRKN